jgi:hypothetical protein
MENQTKLKWHQNPNIVIVLLVLFFPLGLFFMWKNGLWSSKVRWIVSGLFLLIVVANMKDKNSSNSIKEELTQESLNKQSQVFIPTKSVYFLDPWSSLSQGQSIETLFGLKADKDKYGDFTQYASGWVLFKMKLVIPESRKKAYLEIPFTYYAKNCWGNENRKGSLYFFSQGENPLLEDIVQNSDLGENFLTNAQNGDLIDLYVYQTEFSIKSPKHACDETYASIKASKGIRYFKNGKLK